MSNSDDYGSTYGIELSKSDVFTHPYRARVPLPSTLLGGAISRHGLQTKVARLAHEKAT